MILFALIVIWLLLIAFLLALCRIAAAADDRNDAATGRYPTLSAAGSEAKSPGPFARPVRLPVALSETRRLARTMR